MRLVSYSSRAYGVVWAEARVNPVGVCLRPCPSPRFRFECQAVRDRRLVPYAPAAADDLFVRYSIAGLHRTAQHRKVELAETIDQTITACYR
jgi:hypothetical protein